MARSLASSQPVEGEFLPPDSVALKIASLGYDDLLADYYWLRFIQYFGGGEARQRDRYASAEKYLRLIVMLDPHFLAAYDFVAFGVGGEEGRPDTAKEILDFGISHNQDSWRLPFLAGINEYLFARNELEAANYYDIASRRPHAPPWLARQAGILRTKLPSTMKAINVWKSAYETAVDNSIKRKAQSELVKLWTDVYQASRSEELKKTAANQLRILSFQI
jgi:hypothetical protein